MNPNDIKLDNLSKALEYEKFSRNMKKITDPDQLRDFACYFAKLYLRQQEVAAMVLQLDAGSIDGVDSIDINK